MLEQLAVRLKESGFAARVAGASSWSAAHACARHLARPTFVGPQGQDVAIVHDLPITALRLSPQILEGLHTLGFERVSDLVSPIHEGIALTKSFACLPLTSA